MLEYHMKLSLTEPKFFSPKTGNTDQKFVKNSIFFNLLKNLTEILLNLFYDENVYYLLCSCTNSLFGKSFFLSYRPNCSQSIRLWNFLTSHIFRISQWNSLISGMLIYINKKLIKTFSRINRWNELIFLQAGADPRKLKVIWMIFGYVQSKMGMI